MKCIRNGDVIQRVSDQEAVLQVKKGWSYCPKADYKKAHPDKKGPAPRKKDPKAEKQADILA